MLLSIRDLDDRGPEAGAGEGVDHPIAVERTDPFARDQRAASGEPARGQPGAELGEKPAADDDRIGARAELDLHLLGRNVRPPRLAHRGGPHRPSTSAQTCVT